MAMRWLSQCKYVLRRPIICSYSENHCSCIQKRSLILMPKQSSTHFLPNSLMYRLQTRSKMSERAMRRMNLRKNKKQKVIPPLKSILRRLYLLTHPDLFGQYPEQQRCNDESYKELMGMLSSIQGNNEFPAAKSLNLPFFLKTPIEGQFKKVSLSLRTTGGACNTLVEESLGTFFTECGLPSVFSWEVGSWGRSTSKIEVKNPNMEDDSDDVDPVSVVSDVKQAPAYHSTYNNPLKEDTIELALEEYNEVLEMIAAMPWLDDEEHAEIRQHYTNGTGLDEFEERGYRIKSAVHRLWRGERDLEALIKGLDSHSGIILQRILMHATDIDRKVAEILKGETESHL